MAFPVSLSEISLWLGATGIFLLLISEFLPLYNGKTTILINRKRLRNVALTVTALFLTTVAVTMATFSY